MISLVSDMGVDCQRPAKGAKDLVKVTLLKLVSDNVDLVGLVRPVVVHRHNAVALRVIAKIVLALTDLILDLVIRFSLDDLLGLLVDNLASNVVYSCSLPSDDGLLLHQGSGAAQKTLSCGVLEYFWVLALSVTLGLICGDVLGVLFRNGFASEVGIEWRVSIRLESGSLAQLPLLRDFEQESGFCFYSVEV